MEQLRANMEQLRANGRELRLQLDDDVLQALRGLQGLEGLEDIEGFEALEELDGLRGMRMRLRGDVEDMRLQIQEAQDAEGMTLNVVRADGDLQATLRVKNGKRTLRVFDGEEKIYEGPVDTNEQRDALPEKAAEQLKLLEATLNGVPTPPEAPEQDAKGSASA
jgi:hypothetical protein